MIFGRLNRLYLGKLISGLNCECSFKRYLKRQVKQVIAHAKVYMTHFWVRFLF